MLIVKRILATIVLLFSTFLAAGGAFGDHTILILVWIVNFLLYGYYLVTKKDIYLLIMIILVSVSYLYINYLRFYI